MDNRDLELASLGLKEQPFAPTADPAYYFAAQPHTDCLARLWRHIDGGHGIALVVGGAGSGKTTLLRKLLTGMKADPERYCSAVLGSPIPAWTSFALLEAIVGKFHLCSTDGSVPAHMEALQEHLLSNRSRVNTLFIDDAQNLNKRGQLELLRLLQNLETAQRKLLNVILFAQESWVEVLQAAPSFTQRINTRCVLPPLDAENVRDLVAFRMEHAGGGNQGQPLFEEAALRTIHTYSEGNPRLAVNLCRDLLAAAIQRKTSTIGQNLVLQIIDKTALPNTQEPERPVRLLPEIKKEVPATPPRLLEPSPPARPAQQQVKREQRAADMLLRANKAPKETGGAAP